MNDAFEILMEAIPWVHVSTMLETIGRMAESVSRTELDGEPVAIGDWFAGSADDFPCSSCMIQTINGFRLGSAVYIPTLLIRVFKFEETISIDFSFDMDWSNVAVAMPMLHRHFQQLKLLSGARTVFGGMEPAQDLDTRFFTDDARGPLGSSIA
ncbi:hypothetical protein [Stenotrophomonas sp. TD3]|uniref:hypothetical protein n=1 Tax=Stenotrophomonas sp. TD3 TaxID=1641707 RepID=UPI000AD8BEED|nr:hypothetical protein [Stenotrophomonas sp. TD3]